MVLIQVFIIGEYKTALKLKHTNTNNINILMIFIMDAGLNHIKHFNYI